MSVFDEVKAERRAQDAKWGGPVHDDGHHQPDWAAFVVAHAKRAVGVDFRRQMVRVAALAIAAIESDDRKAEAWRQLDADHKVGRLKKLRSRKR